VSGERVKDSTVMVTGGCGFIGSHLVRRLVELGANRVVVVDSLRYGDRANLAGLSDAVEVVKLTLGHDSPALLAEKVRGVRFLFHLAAEKHNQSKDSPVDVFRSNVEGTYTLFDLAARSGVEKIVFTSSLYAYGRMKGGPFVEDEVPQPQTIYGISKLCGEHLLRHFHMQHGTPYNVLRYLFVYGPRQYAGMGYKSVIVKNFERLIRNEPPIVYGDGEQTLDYVFVDDAVEATLAAMEASVDGEVFNVGSGSGTTVNQLLELMRGVAKRSLPVQHEPPDWTAGSRRLGNIEKIRRTLGWEPRVSLRDGLERTYLWMRSQAV
jgi:nucleoside-diphosphate-sugar epimerase